MTQKYEDKVFTVRITMTFETEVTTTDFEYACLVAQEKAMQDNNFEFELVDEKPVEATPKAGIITEPTITKVKNGAYTLTLPGANVGITRLYGTKTRFHWLADGHYYKSKKEAVNCLVNSWNLAVSLLHQEQEDRNHSLWWIDAFDRAEIAAFYPLVQSWVWSWCDDRDEASINRQEGAL